VNIGDKEGSDSYMLFKTNVAYDRLERLRKCMRNLSQCPALRFEPWSSEHRSQTCPSYLLGAWGQVQRPGFPGWGGGGYWTQGSRPSSAKKKKRFAKCKEVKIGCKSGTLFLGGLWPKEGCCDRWWWWYSLDLFNNDIFAVEVILWQLRGSGAKLIGTGEMYVAAYVDKATDLRTMASWDHCLVGKCCQISAAPDICLFFFIILYLTYVQHCAYALGYLDIDFQIYLPYMWEGAIIEERYISGWNFNCYQFYCCLRPLKKFAVVGSKANYGIHINYFVLDLLSTLLRGLARRMQ
jgi:hypothetical protein